MDDNGQFSRFPFFIPRRRHARLSPCTHEHARREEPKQSRKKKKASRRGREAPKEKKRWSRTRETLGLKYLSTKIAVNNHRNRKYIGKRNKQRRTGTRHKAKKEFSVVVVDLFQGISVHRSLPPSRSLCSSPACRVVFLLVLSPSYLSSSFLTSSQICLADLSDSHKPRHSVREHSGRLLTSSVVSAVPC